MQNSANHLEGLMKAHNLKIKCNCSTNVWKSITGRADQRKRGEIIKSGNESGL